MRNRLSACLLLLIGQLLLSPFVAGADCTCTKKKVQSPHPPQTACISTAKGKCELAQGLSYQAGARWADASQHCLAAITSFSSSKGGDEAKNAADARACFDDAEQHLAKDRTSLFSTRLGLVQDLVNLKEYAAAETQLKALRVLDASDPKLTAPEKNDHEGNMNAEAAKIADGQRQWPSWTPSRLRMDEWFPPVASRLLAFLTYVIVYPLILFALYNVLRLFRFALKVVVWNAVRRPHSYNGTIKWTVSKITDDTKQLAAGAVMDALNIRNNPLFQELPTSSLLAIPPALTGGKDQKTMPLIDPSASILQNFLVDPDIPIRYYLSNEFEGLDGKFDRHIFRQVDAFDDINLKLGPVEASVSAIFSNVLGWWTNGWPTVKGAVVIETVGGRSFARVRLVCSYGVRQSRQELPRDQAAPNRDAEDVQLGDLLLSEGTLAVFASTEIDEFSDAVALASQRAAFRLLYRLSMRPEEPNLAIAASSYRQGVRLLISAL